MDLQEFELPKQLLGGSCTTNQKLQDAQTSATSCEQKYDLGDRSASEATWGTSKSMRLDVNWSAVDFFLSSPRQHIQTSRSTGTWKTLRC